MEESTNSYIEMEAIRLGALRSPVEMNVVPMRAASAPTKPIGPDFSYELKLDGIRCIVRKNDTDVLLQNRHGRDITRVYPDLARHVAELHAPRFIVDGEIIAIDKNGRPSFERLARRSHLFRDADIRLASKRIPVLYVVFDLLAVGDCDVRRLPLSARRKLLRLVLPTSGVIRLNDVFEGDPTPLLSFCQKHRLEGLVAKRNDSPYRSGPLRTDDWIKIKNEIEGDFVVVGFTIGEGARKRMGAIDVASFEGGKYVYRGKVGSGLDDVVVGQLLERLMPLRTNAPTAIGDYHPAPRGRIHVRPEVVVSVKYAGYSDSGGLRFPVYRGVRDDVLPEECTVGPDTDRDQ